MAFLFLLLSSIALEFYGRSCGFLLTSDSFQYLSAAESFMQDGRFLSPDGSYYSYWPPLFPVILASTSQPFVLMVWINIACKIVIGVLLVYIAANFLKDNFLKITFLGVSLLGVYFIMISVFLWSELMFMTFAFLSIYFSINVRRQHFFTGLLITGFLMCLQRNAGLFWVSGVSVWLLFHYSMSIRKNLLMTILFFIISSSGFVAWNIYNTHILSADFNVYKHDYFVYLFHNISLIADTIARMIFPHPTGWGWIVLAGMISMIVFPLRKSFTPFIALLTSILTMYTLGYSVLPQLDVYEMDRYFSIVAPIVFLLMLMGLEQFIVQRSAVIRKLVLLGIILWLAYPLGRVVKNVQLWHERSCFTDSTK